MEYLLGALGVLIVAAGIFVAGVLVGKANQQKVLKAIAIAKDPLAELKKVL